MPATAGHGSLPEYRPIGPICEATVVVSALDASVEAYTRGLGWEVRGPAGPLESEAAAGVDPQLIGCPALAVGPPPPAACPAGVRLVEVPGGRPLEPLRTHGWSALELGVTDVGPATERAGRNGWRVLFRPVTLGGGRLPLIASQLAGPDGEGVYLTQVLGEVPGFELPEPRRDADGIFIAVLGASSLEGSRAAIEDRFAVRRASDRRVPVRVLNVQYDLPLDTPHQISSLQLAGSSCLEVDQLPAAAMPRRTGGGGVPSGMHSVAVRSDAVHRPTGVLLPDGAHLELRPLEGSRHGQDSELRS